MDIEINRLTEIAIYTGEEPDENSIWIDDNSEVRIEAGSLHLTNAIADTDLKFGQLIAGEFQVTLFNLSTDVTGRNIKVWVTENNVRSEIFTGKIESAEHDNINRHRKITAYDWAYYNRDINVADFWNEFWETNKNATTIRLDWFRSQLLNYLGIMGGAVSLYNDDLNIAGEYEKVTVLTFESLLIMISELQCALPHINAGGALDFITLDNTNTVDLRTNKVESDSSTWEDFTVQPISGIAVWEDSNNLYKVIGEETNPYNISSNLILMHFDKTVRDNICTQLLNQMTGFSYIPCSLNMIVSDLSLELGQRIRTDKGYSYIMSNEIFGSMWVEQTIECRATAGTRPLIGETYNDNMVNGLKTAVIKKDIDELNIKYTGMAEDMTELSSEISVMAGKIVLQVNGAGGVSALRLDGTGPQASFTVNAPQINLDGYDIVLNGTNGITITSPNFSVTRDGTIRAIKGYIGGLALTDNSIRTDDDSGMCGVSVNEWEEWDNVDGEGHNGYRSFSNWHVANSVARTTLNISGYETFAIVIRSDGETTHDYTIAGTLDATNITTSSPNNGTTKGNQKQNVSCVYENLGGEAHTIELIYVKDGSVNTGEDRGYFFIDEENCIQTSEAENFRLTSANFSRVINGTKRDNLRLAIGNKFGVAIDGTMYANIGEFNGAINVNNKFIVDSQGNMTALNGNVKGTIKSGSGDQYTEISAGLLKFAKDAKIQFCDTEGAGLLFDVLTFQNIGTAINPQPSINFTAGTGDMSVSGVNLSLTGVNTTLKGTSSLNLQSNGTIALSGNSYSIANLNPTNESKMLVVLPTGTVSIQSIPDSVVANPSGTASTTLTKIQIGSTKYNVGGTTVVANPSGTASTDLTKITIGSTIYSIPSGGGSVGQRVDASWTGGIVSIPADSYRNVKRIWLAAGTYLIQMTIKFRNIGDIQIGVGTNGNERDLQERVYNGDKISVSRIIKSTGFYVNVGIYCKGAANDVLTGYNYGSDVDTSDVSIIEYIKLSD